MWDRNFKLISSSEIDKKCLQRKALSKGISGENSSNVQRSLPVGMKKNALAQLSAMYPDSSGESSPELSDDDNGDADDKLPTRACNDGRTELPGAVKETKGQCKHEDQSKLKLKEEEPLKNHGYSVGRLLSKLRSEDAAKGNKSKKCKARTDPPKDQGPCRELQFTQLDAHTKCKTDKLLDDTHILNAKKNTWEKRKNTEDAVQKEWSMSKHLKVTGEDLIKKWETCRNLGEAIATRRDDHPREMQDETHLEQCITLDPFEKTTLVPHTSDGISLQHKHLTEDESSVTQVQCKQDKEVMMLTQESGNSALETTIDGQFPPSNFPIPTEATLELPVEYHTPEGKKSEVSDGDGAHKSTEQNDAVLESNMRVQASVAECHSGNVLHPISPERPQSLCTAQEEVDKSCPAPNLDREQTERSLDEASCDLRANQPCSPALDLSKEGDKDVDVGMADKHTIDENNENRFDAMLNLHFHCETEEQSPVETRALVTETSVSDHQSGPIISQEGNATSTDIPVGLPLVCITSPIDHEKHKDVLVPPEVSKASDQDFAERSKDNHVPQEVCDTLNQDLTSFPSEKGDVLNNQLEVGLHCATVSEPQSTEDLDNPSRESCDSIIGKPILEFVDVEDDVTDIADADLGDLSVHGPSIGCVTRDEEVTDLVCQESDKSMDESFSGLSNALDREFSSNSPIPIVMTDCNMRLKSAANMIATETINTSSLNGAKVGEVTGQVCQESDQSMDGSLLGLSNALDREFSSNSPTPTLMKDCNMRPISASNMITSKNFDNSLLINSCKDVEKEGNQNCFVDHDANTVISRSASPFEGSNELADKPVNADVQGVLALIEREVWGEDFKLPSCQNHRKSDGGQEADQSETSVLPEFDVHVSHRADYDLQDDSLKETYSELDQVSEQDFKTSTTEQQEGSPSTSHLAEDRDDVLSLVCDTEDLMSSLDDLLQDESLPLSKQSPTPDEKTTVSDNCTSTSTKDNSTTNLPKTTSSQKCRLSTRDEDRPSWDSKQGCYISIHTRHGNSRFVCKKQDSYRAVVERSPQRVPGPNRNWTASKPLSASERLALNQRLGAQNAANTTPKLDLRQLMRNGPAIQSPGILQHQLQQHQQQQIQRHLQRQLPPALQLRLGLVNNTGQQCTPDDVALIVQRQQVMIEKIIQLYQKQRESDVVMEKQKQIIRHYQRAFLIAKKGGPLSMQGIQEESNRPRPRSPSPSANPERQIGRKWPVAYGHEVEQRYVEHQEAKRMKYDADMHLGDRSSGHPDVAQPPQRNFEHRTQMSRRNPDQTGNGAGCNISQQERQHEHGSPSYPRLQREERMIISVSSYPQDDVDQERRCVLQSSTPIFPGTRNHPHRNIAGQVFPPIRESLVEQYEGFRSPHMVQRGVPYQRPQSHPNQSFQQERASPVMACQVRSPSPLHPNWESFRILERDPGIDRIDYHHSSIHPRLRRAEMQQERPPFIDPDRRGCSSPMYHHPPASRNSSPDEEVGQAYSRAPVSLGRLHNQDVFQAPMGPSQVNNQNIFRAPMRPSEADSQGIHRASMHQVIHRTTERPSVADSRGIQRGPLHTSEVNGPGVHRASFHPALVTISHHWTAQNFEGAPGVLARLQHPPGIRESEMQPHMEYQQYPG